MTEKLRLDIPLLLPEVVDERDRCVDRLNAMLAEKEGITRVHIISDTEPAKLCIHFNPEQITLSRVYDLAQAAGVQITERYGHILAQLVGPSSIRQALTKTERLRRIKGVLDAQVSAAGALRIEYDREIISREELYNTIARLKLKIRRDLSDPPLAHPPTTPEKHRDLSQGSRTELTFAIITGVFTLIGWLLPKFVTLPAPWIELIPLWIAYFFGSFFTLREVIEQLREGKFQIDLLMLAAATGAAFLGVWVEGALLLFLFSLGHSLEHYAMGRAKRAIESLAGLTPDEATVLRDGKEQVIPIEALKVGDRVLVKPHERISADGFVIEGQSAVDQAPITGESIPVEKRPIADAERAMREPDYITAAHAVFAGTINGEGALTVQVTKRASDSTLARVVQMVTEAETMRSPSQQFAVKFERIFVPAILVFVALLIFAFIPLDEPFADSFYRAMAVLVAASPCALAISTPSAVLSGVAAAGHSGVLVKGGAPLEHLGSLQSMAFDKTGTLTSGLPRVTAVQPYGDTSEEELLSVAVAVERLSNHPLARAVVRYGDENLPEVRHEARDLKSATGRGLRATIGDKEVLLGKKALFDESPGTPLPGDLRACLSELEQAGQTTFVLRLGDRYLGALGLMDTPRPEAKAMIQSLRKLGISRMLMISGDNQSVADAVAREVGLDEAKGDLMPEDKVEFIKELRQHGPVAMVGDGVNDAPAMANATVAIAMGAAGSDTALETAEIALMSDDLSKIPYSVALSRKTSAIIRQNLWISLGMIAILIPATLSGLAIGFAVVLHEGSTLVVVLNALRLLAFRDTSTAR